MECCEIYGFKICFNVFSCMKRQWYYRITVVINRKGLLPRVPREGKREREGGGVNRTGSLPDGGERGTEVRRVRRSLYVDVLY